MSLKHLHEPHTFCSGDEVIVKERAGKYRIFQGKIYSIVNQSMNDKIPQQKHIMVDYFYITFDRDTYDTLLSRGLYILYRGRPVVLGNIYRDDAGKIIQVFAQPHQDTTINIEYEINIEDITAILIWRMGYSIEHCPVSRI
jgi:hypothetical protein